jgi:hypothetical protein
VRNLRTTLRGNELHRAEKACRIAGSKQLFRIVACSTGAAQLLWSGQLDVQTAVLGCGVTVAAPVAVAVVVKRTLTDMMKLLLYVKSMMSCQEALYAILSY